MLAPVIDHLWQSTLIVIGAGAATLLLRGHAARWRYWLWFAASMKFLVPFALLTALGAQFAWRTATVEPAQGEWRELARQVFEPSGVFVDADATGSRESLSAGSAPLTTAPPATEQSLAEALLTELETYESNAAATPAEFAPSNAGGAPSRWLRAWSIGVAVWMLGTLVILLRWAARWLGLRSMTKRAKPLTVVELGERSLEVRSCPSIMEPGVFGILRPVLLIPEGIVHRLTPGQLEAIVAHERVHIERRDNLTASLHMLVEALFWFHPFVWWIGARLVHERERACDEAVLAAGVDPHHYASGLVEVCGFYVESPLICAAGVGGGSLEDRVHRITENEPLRPLSAIARAAIIAVPVAVFAVPVAIGLLSPPAIRAQVASESQASSLLACVDPHVLNSLVSTAPLGTVYTDEVPEELSDITTPAVFELIGSARRDGRVGTSTGVVTTAYRTNLGLADAQAAALRALESDGWEPQPRAQRFSMGGVFAGNAQVAPQSDTACLGNRTLNLYADTIGGTTYVTYNFPTDQATSVCARPAGQRLIARGMYDRFVPRLEFPPDPETGAPTRFSGGGGMSSSGTSQQNTTEITHRAPLGDIAEYLARQMTDQGWEPDASWAGSTTAGSAWSKEFDPGQRMQGTLEITRTSDSRYSFVFRVLALQ